MREFAFMVNLAAVVRVTSATEEDARALLPEALDCLDLTEVKVDGPGTVHLTEASLASDARDILILEVDGPEL